MAVADCDYGMDQAEVESRLRAKIGQAVSVTFDSHTENVTVVSVDTDGFVCRPQVASLADSPSEFWIAHKDVSELAEPTT